MFDSITKAALLTALENVPDDAVVAFSSNYGDRGQTEQVHELIGEVDEKKIRETAYSVSGYAVNNDNAADDEELVTVWIIS